MKGRTLRAALLAIPLLSGCSATALERAAYESAHSASDLEHGDDPRYRREPRDYDRYQRQRKEVLSGEEGQPPPAPAPPPASAP